MATTTQRRVLVLAGLGLSGLPLVRELARDGHCVLVTSRGLRAVDVPAGVEHHALDLAGFDSHLPTLRRFAPDVVVDMLALRGEDTARVAAFTGIAARAIVISSVDVYLAFGRLWKTEPGDPVPLPLTEDAPRRTRLVRPGYDKCGVEDAARQLDLPVTILRLPAVHGPGDAYGRLWPYLRRMRAGHDPITLPAGLSHWRWTRGYAENVAHAIALATTDDRASGRTYNVGEDAMDEAAWIRAIGRVTGWSGDTVEAQPGTFPAWQDFDFRQDYVVATTRIRQELDYREIIDLDEGLRRTAAWELEHPAADDWLGNDV